MPLVRLLVPIAAALVVGGLIVALVATGGKPGSPGGGNQDYSDLLALKREAEALTVEGKLAEAHAKYRAFAAASEGRTVKDPFVHQLIEDARFHELQIYNILIARQGPARAATSPDTMRPGATQPVPKIDELTGQRPAVATTAPHSWPGRDTAETRPTTSLSATRGTATASTTTNTTTTTTSPATATASGSPFAPPDRRRPGQPTRFRVAPAPAAADFSDDDIGIALLKANYFLRSQLKDGQIQHGKDVSETYRQGINALVLYALLASGQAIREPGLYPTAPEMRAAIDKMKLHAMATDPRGPQGPVTYARALRASALALSNSPEDRQVLRDDVTWLVNAHLEGAYTYDDRYSVRMTPLDPKTGTRRELDGSSTRPTGDRKPGRFTPGVSRPVPSSIAALPEAGGPLRDEKGRPIELADGLHDPRTGRELIPNWRPPPPPPSVFQPPQMLPDQYVGPFLWDNSNSQYGLMGVAAGASAGVEVPDAYWAAVQNHWLSCQYNDGQWPYRKEKPGGYLAMTAGGISSLLVTHDQLEAPAVPRTVGGGNSGSAATAALDRGLAWLEAGENAVDVMGPRTVYLGYTLHALSRVGLLTGFKHLGKHEWYRDLARKVVLSQNDNGSWGKTDQATADTLIDTAYSVLFLARGRHPIIMNKLRLDPAPVAAGTTTRPAAPAVARGAWNNRPRDLVNLAGFASRELERPVNFQIVSINREAADWSDAPILYLASHAAVKLTDAEAAKIRAFVDAGGMLFTQSDGGADAFNIYVASALHKQLFPEAGREFKHLPADHEIYTLNYLIPPAKRPVLRYVHNGARVVWIHSPQDIAIHWQQRATTTRREAFELGVNLFVYAGGKTELRNRIDARAIAEPAARPAHRIGVARLKYAGNWNPEPAAFGRFGRYFQTQTGVGLDVQEAEVKSLAANQGVEIAHLAGTTGWTPTDDEANGLADFVKAGGTLIVESVGPADSPFTDSLLQLIPRAFAAARLEAVPADHPMLRATFAGMEDVWAPRVRPYALAKLGGDPKAVPPIRMAAFGKGRIIYLPLDATSGLLGVGTWPIFGYEPAESQALMKNLVLWAAENPGRE